MPDVNFLQQPNKAVSGGGTVKKAPDERKSAPETPVRGVNLMTGESRAFLAQETVPKNLRILLGACCAALAAVLILFLGLKGYGFLVTQQLRELVSTRSAVDAQITTLEKDGKTLIAFQNKLSALKALFENHTYWSQFFIEFEKNVLPTVTFDGVSIAAGNAISMSGTAPDYQTVGRQLLAFQRATGLMSSVRITSGDSLMSQTGDVTGVRFEVSFSINPDVLKQK